MQLKQTHQVVWRNPRKITKKTNKISDKYLEFSSSGANLHLFSQVLLRIVSGRTFDLSFGYGKYLLPELAGQQLCPPKKSFESCGAKMEFSEYHETSKSHLLPAVCNDWGKFFPLALDHPKKIPERGCTSRILEWVSTGETFAARIRLMRAWPTSNICWKRLYGVKAKILEVI